MTGVRGIANGKAKGLARRQALVEPLPIALDGEPTAQADARATRTPAHSVRPHGRLEALQVQGAEWLELERQTAADEQPHDVGDHDLPAVGGVAQAPRGDDGPPEQVIVLVAQVMQRDRAKIGSAFDALMAGAALPAETAIGPMIGPMGPNTASAASDDAAESR